MSAEGLQPFRRRLDAIDDEIARLLGERFQICREVAVYKSEPQIPMMQPNRVEQVRARYLERGAAAVDLPAEFTADLFDLLIAATCKAEDELMDLLAAAADSGAAGAGGGAMSKLPPARANRGRCRRWPGCANRCHCCGAATSATATPSRCGCCAGATGSCSPTPTTSNASSPRRRGRRRRRQPAAAAGPRRSLGDALEEPEHMQRRRLMLPLPRRGGRRRRGDDGRGLPARGRRLADRGRRSSSGRGCRRSPSGS